MYRHMVVSVTVDACLYPCSESNVELCIVATRTVSVAAARTVSSSGYQYDQCTTYGIATQAVAVAEQQRSTQPYAITATSA
jgi:hypothetical protein